MEIAADESEVQSNKGRFLELGQAIRLVSLRSYQMTTIGFIGTGHMGSILVRKLIETGAIKAEEIYVSNRTPEKAEQLARELGVRAGHPVKCGLPPSCEAGTCGNDTNFEGIPGART